jgi:hypothetical protein
VEGRAWLAVGPSRHSSRLCGTSRAHNPATDQHPLPDGPPTDEHDRSTPQPELKHDRGHNRDRRPAGDSVRDRLLRQHAAQTDRSRESARPPRRRSIAI